MILSEIEIWAEIRAGWLAIDPEPSLHRVGASSVDLSLHDELLIFPQDATDEFRGTSVDPSSVDVTPFVQRHACKHNLGDQPYEVAPGEFLLSKTYEHIELPAHLAARVEGKSSLGRLGLAVHLTAPTVQAGWKGRLTLEMYNAGPFTLKLTSGMDICQLIIERLGIPTQNPYSGKYMGQM